MKCPIKLFTQLLRSVYLDLETWSLVIKFAHEVSAREDYLRHRRCSSSRCFGRSVGRTRQKSRMSWKSNARFHKRSRQLN